MDNYLNIAKLKDELYMHRCIELASLGNGYTQTNPLVGCVIVHQNKIIAEGYHQKFGQAHAEVNAFAQINDKSVLSQCDVYVNLEPCSHHGKTPACTSLFKHYPCKRLIIGMLDPNPKVAGKGMTLIQNLGIAIKVGVLEQECKKLNRAFIFSVLNQKPYVIAKWAQSSDAFLGHKQKKTNISNTTVDIITQKWRSEYDAYLIGNNTLSVDSPQLNSRIFTGKQPLRCVIGSNIDLANSFFKVGNKCHIFSMQHIESLPHNCSQSKEIDLEKVLEILYSKDIGTLVIEGGTQTIQSFLDHGLVNEIRRITNNHLTLNQGVKSPLLEEVHFELAYSEFIRDNTIETFIKTE